MVSTSSVVHVYTEILKYLNDMVTGKLRYPSEGSTTVVFFFERSTAGFKISIRSDNNNKISLCFNVRFTVLYIIYTFNTWVKISCFFIIIINYKLIINN